MPDEKKKRAPFRVTKMNWKPAYTQIVYWSQKDLSVPEIAKKVGMCTESVQRVRASEYFRERFANAQETYERHRSRRLAEIQSTDATQRKLDRAAKKSADILIKALKGAKDISRQQIFVAKDLLDRTGYKAKERIEVETYSHNYTPQEIQSAQTTLLEVRDILDTIGTRGTNFILSKARTTTEKEKALIKDADEVTTI